MRPEPTYLTYFTTYKLFSSIVSTTRESLFRNEPPLSPSRARLDFKAAGSIWPRSEKTPRIRFRC